GTVRFMSSDGQASLPADYAFTAVDAGSHTFIATLKSAGTRSITATDTVLPSLSGSQGGIVVTPAAAAALAATGFTTPTTAGAAHSLTVTVRDAFGNVATGYTGTVHFTSTDGLASLPADYAFTGADAGSRAFTVILKSAGTRSLTVTDQGNAALGGTQ